MEENRANLENFYGKKLRKIIVSRIEENPNKNSQTIFTEKINLVFEDNLTLLVTPICETDEIEMSISNKTHTDYKNDEFQNSIDTHFQGLYNKKFGSFWTCINPNGYFDVLLFSFDNLHPSLLILSEGNLLKISTIEW